MFTGANEEGRSGKEETWRAGSAPIGCLVSPVPKENYHFHSIPVTEDIVYKLSCLQGVLFTSLLTALTLSVPYTTFILSMLYHLRTCTFIREN